MAANGMKNDLLQVDQKLTIPAGPVPRGPDGQIVPTVTPTPKSGLFKVLVQEGDTIDSIAKRMGSSIEAIVQANELITSAGYDHPAGRLAERTGRYRDVQPI